jgi:hypothetical protein
VATILGAAALASAARATPPVVYSAPHYQSPMRGDPDDLLLLPGDGFSADDVVVYQAIADTTRVFAAPASLPQASTASEGIADVASIANVPYSLTIHLPAVMRRDQSYALWVRNARGEWSNEVRINDARPLWISPAFVYSSATVAGLPRRLKVIGRNLQPAAGQITRVRLSGPNVLILTAATDDTTPSIAHYVAEVALPSRLAVGSYQVEVSRDGGVSWVLLKGQKLAVKPNPPNLRRFPVSAYGCRADDADDDVGCVLKAIAAARVTGRGAVVFGPGVWRLRDSTARLGVEPLDGIIVPKGVSLIGSGMGVTIIERDTNWASGTSKASATFTLQGGNIITGVTFRDAHRYGPADGGGVMLRLGKTYYRVDPRNRGEPKAVSDVVIYRNGFDKPRIAIGDGGLPIQNLFIAYNEFGAYYLGLGIGGDRYDMTYVYHVDNSVIAYNTFKPGSYIDPAIGQGAMASEIGAARHVDFSRNTADGTATDYLYSSTDPRGWRAAFFWHLNNNQEMLLVAQNTATCTGDKAGDGEAIAFDNNANTFPFDGARTVLAATRDTVTVAGPLIDTQSTKDIRDRLGVYYREHWLQIAQGSGLGQVRRIAAYSIDPVTTRVTFKVTPDWDVIPHASVSRVTAARQYWQVYTVDNLIDHRTPLCRKSNANGPKGGSIALWGQTADSVVEGNRLYDTSGIAFQQTYSAASPAGGDCGATGCSPGTSFLAFVDLRGNTIDGEYDWKSDCSVSGFYGSHSASPTPASPPPVTGYGVSIVRNTIRHADGLRGGAITLPLTWYSGPPPGQWNLVDNTLIHHNAIADLVDPAPDRRCDAQQTHRIGINISDPLIWRTTLYANTCSQVSRPLNDAGTQTVRLCPESSPENSCECAPAASEVSVSNQRLSGATTRR